MLTRLRTSLLELEHYAGFAKLTRSVVQEAGEQGVKRTPKSFDLLKILATFLKKRIKSLNI